MFEIVVCDDCLETLRSIESMLKQFVKDNANINYKLVTTGRKLMSIIERTDTSINLLFLDIEMPNEDGITIKNKLESVDKVEKIVFISSHIEKMKMAFGLKVIGFIEKPIIQEELLFWVNNVYTNFKYSNVITIKDREVKEIDIKYVSADGNYTVAKMNDNEQTDSIRKSIREWEAQLTDDFVRIHKSYLVNLNYIREIRYTCILLDDAELPVGRTYIDSLKEKYEKFILKKVKERNKWD